jgi:trehalose 6-phosphate synthase/phosphatase
LPPPDSTAIVLLDYDGTLVPLAPTPERAAPDAELLALLTALGARPNVELHIVSGRPREVLDAWLGAVPAALHAEHGLWVRRARGADGEWQMRFAPDVGWLREGARIMGEASRALPGSFVEQKTASLAWHYRLAEPAAAAGALESLRRELAPLADRHGLELLDGARVLELRDTRANKGAVAKEIAEAAPTGARIVAMGDDTTDEDMFAALPADAQTIKIGEGPTKARERLSDSAAARAWLTRSILKAG